MPGSCRRQNRFSSHLHALLLSVSGHLRFVADDAQSAPERWMDLSLVRRVVSRWRGPPREAMMNGRLRLHVRSLNAAETRAVSLSVTPSGLHVARVLKKCTRRSSMSAGEPVSCSPAEHHLTGGFRTQGIQLLLNPGHGGGSVRDAGPAHHRQGCGHRTVSESDGRHRRHPA